MPSRSSFGPLASALIIALIGVLLASLTLLLYWNELERRTDALCASKSWSECAPLVASDFSLRWPFVDSSGSAQGLSQGAEQGAPATLLQNYFLDLSDGHTEQSQLPAASAVVVIVDRAKFYEYQWHFSHLSEAYWRCAVGLYRKRAKAALANVGSNKQAAAESLESLANSLRHLAELYQRHGKYLIAEKALKESIDVATQGFALADQKSAERLRAELLVDYGAHIKILNDLGRTPEAERESKLLLDQ